MATKRSAFTLFQLLVVLAVLALLFALFLPAISRMRVEAAKRQSQFNLRQLALSCHNYNDTYGALPPGVDKKGFSAAAQLLPFIEQANLWQQIAFKESVDDKDNRKVAGTVVKTFVDPLDPVNQVEKDLAPTNYLFSAGAKTDLKDNNGVFFRESKIGIGEVAAADGASCTIMIGQTLKGDGSTKATDVKRQIVSLKKDELKNLQDDSGVKDFKDDKNIAGDRCRSWMYGRFLQGTFTGTRSINDDKPDVDCGGAGGLSALRGTGKGVNIAMCDGSVRFVTPKIKLDLWKALVGRNDGLVVPPDFDHD